MVFFVLAPPHKPEAPSDFSVLLGGTNMHETMMTRGYGSSTLAGPHKPPLRFLRVWE